ncbi:uncharacterized protein KD926_010197 [Aspergillus affinis]|uniref:uncharacterized protein n=1 Tax=Aspergillus affinis TaxID=1070780 RepID=UPI0022FDC7BC|nr:uncharacterized protein KD926_010197 [Aspergillus affinis]KAI9038864.1 hypothetical protein KD926_010197 [Aspergillus affinis]
MSSVPTETQKDETFLCIGPLSPDLPCLEYIQSVIECLKIKTFEICNKKPNLFPAACYHRVYTIYVDSSRDIEKQVEEYLPNLIKFLEKNMEQEKEYRTKSLEG